MAATTTHLTRAGEGGSGIIADSWENILENRHLNHWDANESDMQLIKDILTKLFHCLLFTSYLTWLDLKVSTIIVFLDIIHRLVFI